MGSVAGRTAMVVVVVVVVDRGRGRGGTATRWRGVRLDFGIDGTRETRCRLDLVVLQWLEAWGDWAVGALHCVTLSVCDR